MKAAVMTEVGKIEFVEREMPKINDDQVLVRIDHVGLCGSDIHYYQHGRIGDFVVENPIILGHESAGTVMEVGKNVKTLKKGDLVALEPASPAASANSAKLAAIICARMLCLWPPRPMMVLL